MSSAAIVVQIAALLHPDNFLTRRDKPSILESYENGARADCSCRDVRVDFCPIVKLCAPDVFIHTVNGIDRSSVNFTETICCRAKFDLSDGGKSSMNDPIFFPFVTPHPHRAG